MLAALAISLLVHAVVAIFVHPWSAQRHVEPVVSMRNVRIVRLVSPPPVKRIPPVAHHRTPVRPPRLAFVPSRTSAPAIRARTGPTAQEPVMPSPAPPRCIARNVPAAVVEEPSPPPIPPALRALDVSGSVAIEVRLGSDGSVTGATVSQSTGSAAFDALAIAMARSAHYTPAEAACKAVASTYLFRAQFYAW